MRILWSTKFLLPTLAVAVSYVVLTVYFMNVTLLNDAVFGDHSWGYAWNLGSALVLGIGMTMSLVSLFLLMVAALLTGANLTLLVYGIRSRRASGKLHFVVGGSSLLGLVSSGCATCALPIVAFLGFGGAIASLPFRGLELSLLAISLLVVSLIPLVRSYGEQQACLLPPSTGDKKHEFEINNEHVQNR